MGVLAKCHNPSKYKALNCVAFCVGVLVWCVGEVPQVQ